MPVPITHGNCYLAPIALDVSGSLHGCGAVCSTLTIASLKLAVRLADDLSAAHEVLIVLLVDKIVVHEEFVPLRALAKPVLR